MFTHSIHICIYCLELWGSDRRYCSWYDVFDTRSVIWNAREAVLSPFSV